MMPDPSIAAAERTETARRLIAQAQADVVDLVTLSALELCVLDGPAAPVFDQRVAQAWTRDDGPAAPQSHRGSHRGPAYGAAS